MTHNPIVKNKADFTHPLGTCLDLLRSRTEARSTHGKKKRGSKHVQPISDNLCSDISMMPTFDAPSDHSSRQSDNPNRTEGQPVKSKRKRKCPNTHSIAIGISKKCRPHSTSEFEKINSTVVNHVQTNPTESKSTGIPVAKDRNSSEPIVTVLKHRKKTNSNSKPHPVSSKKPDKFGIESTKHRRFTDARNPTCFQQNSLRKRDPEVWFDDIAPALVAASRGDQSATGKSLIKASSFAGPTRRIAIDCEFVGVGYEGKENALARVSIVNQFGHVLLDTLVRPAERVVDYRTRFSGIRPEDLRPGGPARPFHAVHKEVAKLCQGRVLVGHSIGNDLKVLMISHPRRSIRDTSKYRPFRALFGGRTPSLRALTERVLGVQVQTGEHDSVEDARAAMRLYTSVKRVWESGKKGRDAKALGLTGILDSRPGAQEHLEPRNELNILTEYESGLDAETGSTKPTVPVVKVKPKVVSWDPVRNRRCSKNRSKFLRKRTKRPNSGTFRSVKM